MTAKAPPFHPAPVPLPPGASAYADWAARIALPDAAGLRPDGPPDGPGASLLHAALVRPLDPAALARAAQAGEVMTDADLPDADPPDDSGPDAPCMLYWPEGRAPAGLEKMAEVLIHAAPVELDTAAAEDDPLPDTLPAALPDTTPDGAQPIVAVIDDGIGFLNARFCRTDPAAPGGLPLRTRFHAVWLQSLRVRRGTGGGLHTGIVLRRGQIDALLARGDRLEEGATYRRLNNRLLRPGAPRLSERGTSHGTHVLDLAAGAAPDNADDPARDWPLLAVQLPPEAVDDTAGTALEPLLVQGVRWCLLQAEGISATAPVIINISYATFAGPKDGTKAVEAQIAQALDRWMRRTGRQARVVLAFGNARLTRQAARIVAGQIGAGQIGAEAAQAEIDWRLPPDDFTASYLEIRPDAPADMARLVLRLTPPDGGAVHVLGPLSPDHALPVTDAAGREVGRFYHIGPRTTAPGVVSPAHGVLAMAPISAEAPRLRAPHGAWHLALSVAQGAAASLRLEVQRDDTPMGYRLNGRQSYLDHPLAEGWDAEARGYGAPDAGCPITRAGTHSSFVTSPSPAMISVGAVRDDTRLPPPYAAEGSVHTIPGPDLAALGDRSALAPGLVAAGTFSGAGRSLDGSSAAAARATRALALMQAQGVTPPGPAEIAALVAGWGQPADPGQAHRLGAGVLTEPRGARHP